MPGVVQCVYQQGKGKGKGSSLERTVFLPLPVPEGEEEIGREEGTGNVSPQSPVTPWADYIRESFLFSSIVIDILIEAKGKGEAGVRGKRG